MFFTLSLPLGYSSLSLSFLLSPSYFSLFFCRTSHTRSRWLQRIAPQPVLPEPWRPTSTRTSTSLRASCQARSLLAGPRLLPFGGLCQRGVETQAVTPSYPLTRTPSSRCVRFASLRLLSLALSPSLSLSLSLSLRNLSDSPSARTHAQFLPSHLSHAVSFFSLLLFVCVFALSSSLSYLLPLCTSSSSSPPLLLLGVSLLGCRLLLLCFRLS